MSASMTVVGRMPIVDGSRAVVGYELRFQRHAPGAGAHQGVSGAHRGPGADDHYATVSASSVAGDLTRLAGSLPVFFVADRSVVTGRTPVQWPASQVVIQTPAASLHSAEVADGCARLRRAGYRIATTEFPLAEYDAVARRDATQYDAAQYAAADHDAAQYAAALDSVDVVTVDCRVATEAQLQHLAARCRDRNQQLMVTGVDTPQAMAGAARADLLQGLAIGRPPTVSSSALTPTQNNALRLASTIMRPETDLDAVENILRAEPALTYQLLQLASIGRLGEPRRNIRSIREALVLMGVDRLRGWVPALMLRPAGRAIDSRLLTVLARASTVETAIRQSRPELTAVAFAAGMFSAFDLLLGIPRAELAATMDLSPGLREHAFGTDSPVATVISDIIDYEHDAPIAGLSGLSPPLLDRAAATGFGWALQAIDTLEEGAAA